MKKADPFSGIPAVPSSLAGQWMAFNHMANHYRKLLNVKPRVNSSLPKPSIKTIQLSPYFPGSSILPMSMRPAVGKKSKILKKPSNESIETLKRPVVSHYHEVDYLTDSVEESITPRSIFKQHKSISKLDKNSRNKNLRTQEQFLPVYGRPSSFQSCSTDNALGSDCESQPEEPRVETMGVSEKIKAFLDHLHEFDRPSSILKSPKLKPRATKSVKVLNASSTNNLHIDVQKCCSHCGHIDAEVNNADKKKSSSNIDANAKLARHSKCFLPCPTPYDSPKKMSAKKPQMKAASSKNSLVSTASISYIMGKSNDAKPKGKKAVGGGSNIIKNHERKRFASGGSAHSVGTIRGSEELTAEDFLTHPLPLSYNNDELLALRPEENFPRTPSQRKVPAGKTQTPIESTPVKTKPRMKKKSEEVTKKRVPSAGYSSQSLSGKATSLSSVGVIGILHNKDSSRDSAYGFSSGESRMTTRESTPEKLSKNQQKSRHNSSGRKTTAKKSTALDSNANKYSKPLHNDSSSTISSEDKYVNFLTEITDDIVTRGIYTNRGLKHLFKAHMDNNNNLNPDKMSNMLEKLRMDLGIPKDDTLNKLEFGYGSIVDNSDSYFYKKNAVGNKRASTIPEMENANTSRHNRNDYLDFMEDFDDSVDNATSSRRKSSSNISKKELSNSGTVKSKKNPPSILLDHLDDLVQSESDAQSRISDTSLSETELRFTLKEVGIDSDTTLEIVKIMKIKESRNQRSSDVQTDSDEPTKTTAKHNITTVTSRHNSEKAEISQVSRSTSPTSCSTFSS